MITLKNLISNSQININNKNNMKESNIESIDEVKIINHSNLAYKLNISVYAQKLMSNEKVVIHNPEVLTYTKNLDLINKLK